MYSNIVLTVVGDFPHAAKAPNLPLWSCAHLHDPPDTPSGRNSLAQPGRPQSQPASDAWKTLGKLSILRRNDLVLSVIILWSILFVSNFPMEIAHRKKTPVSGANKIWRTMWGNKACLLGWSGRWNCKQSPQIGKNKAFWIILYVSYWLRSNFFQSFQWLGTQP